MADRAYNLTLTATDNFSGAFAKLSSSINSIEGAANKLRGALGTLGISLSGAALGMFVTGTISAAAALDDLAESTGSTVENLSALKNQMRVSGVDAGSFETLVNKMAVALGKMGDEGEKAGAQLRALGVTSKDPATAVRQLAENLEKYADGANKAAAVANILGKGTAQYVGVLKDLVNDTPQAATVTAEFAAEAEKAGKEMAKAAIEAESFANKLLNSLLPAFSQFMRMTREGGYYGMRAALGLTPEDLRDVDKAISDTEAKIASLTKLREELSVPTLTNRINNFLSGDVATVDAQLATANLRLQELKRIAADVTRTITAATEGGPAAKPAAPVIDTGALSKAAAEIEKFKKEFADLQRLLAAGSTEEANYQKQLELLADAYYKWGVPLAVVVDLEEKLYRVSPEVTAATKAQAEATESLAKAYQSEIDAGKAVLDNDEARLKAAMDLREEQIKGIKDLETEIKLVGLSEVAKQKLLAVQKAELAIKKEMEGRNNADVIAAIEADRDRTLALLEQKDALEQQVDVWKSIEEVAHDAFINIFQSGKSVFERLRDVLKQTLLELLYQMTIKKWIISIGAAIGIPGQAAAAGNLFGGSMGGGGSLNIGSLLGGGTSAAGMFNSVGGFLAGGAETGFWAGLGSGVSNLGAGFAGMSANVTGALAAAGAGEFALAAGMAIPAALPFILAGLALYSIFKKPRGGPKTGGYAQSGLPDLERFFTPNQKDPEMQQLVDAQTQAYDQILRALGGTGTAGFAFGFDTDPEGTANDRIRAGVSVNGNLLYDTGNIELGSDNAATQAALELEAKRALLAALQASDLPQEIANILDSVTAATADAAAIDEVLGVAQALGSIYELFNSDVLEDGMTAFEDSLLGVNVAIERGVDSVRDLIAEYDGSAESATALAQATSGVYAAAVQAVAQMESMRRAIGSMFQSSALEYRLAGMDPAGQRDFLQQQIARDTDLLRVATDANVIAQVSNAINQNQQRLWGMLTPEEQRASAESFAQAAEAAAALADTQIRTATDAMRGLIEDMLTEVRAAFTEAAATQQEAADTQLVAAQTPITINLRGLPSEVGP